MVTNRFVQPFIDFFLLSKYLLSAYYVPSRFRTLRTEKLLADHFGGDGENSLKELEENSFVLTEHPSAPIFGQEHLL